MANMQYGVIRDSSAERFSDEIYLMRILHATLLSEGRLRRDALGFVTDMADTAELRGFPGQSTSMATDILRPCH